jgi:hypothetical protein
MPRERTRLAVPVEFTVYVCRACGAWADAPEEIQHHSFRCEGRSDLGWVDRVLAVAVQRTALTDANPPPSPPNREEA